MESLWRVIRHVPATLLALSLALLVVAPVSAEASSVKFLGETGYSYFGKIAILTADGYANVSGNGESGPLRVELWAFPAPYTGTMQSGYKLAQYDLGTLGAGWETWEVNSGPVPFASPPAGTWIFTMLLTEFTSFATFNDGYFPDDAHNFAVPVTFGPAVPPALTPQVGLWWNPDESGSGYALDYRHGVLVVTVYSYTSAGAAQWYLASGPLSGATFTATLDKYIAGQCIACAYPGRPALAGNDGTITITFSSPTSATVLLPGGRVIQIQPQAF